MALSMIWLFAFQNLYGYVYQRIGWIVALFMAGLALGCGLVGWRRDQATDGERRLRLLWRRLILVDTLLALSAFSVPVVLPELGALQSGAWTFRLVEVCLSAQVLLGGVLGGASFALAGEAQLAMTARAGAAAGSIVSADHAGACLGALSCGILLVPVFGTAATALLIAGIKVSSAALLFAAPRLSRGA
jgi:spermidine synthase